MRNRRFMGTWLILNLDVSGGMRVKERGAGVGCGAFEVPAMG